MLDPALARLSVEEKINLVEELWDSIASSGHDLPVTDAERAEVKARLDALDKGPYKTTDWEVLRKDLRL